VTRLTLYEHAAIVRGRYGRARKKRRGGSWASSARPRDCRVGRPRRYGPEITQALVKVWEEGDRMCSKLLVAVLPAVVEGL